MRRLRSALNLALVAALAFIALSPSTAQALPSFAEVKAAYQPSDTLILDRHGEVLHRLRTDLTVRRGQWTGLSEVSPALRTAMVLSEDQRFYAHSGVDWRAVTAAAWANLWNQRTRGASTITMQLAGLLDDDLRRAAGGRSIPQKLAQAWSAETLERHWRKDQILEAYLNLVPWRGELVGIDALSNTLWNKAPHGLDDREAALAAALVRAPNAAPAAVARRACDVLQLMQAPQRADCTGLDLLATGSLARRAFDASEGLAPHLARQLVRQVRTEPLTASASTTIRSSLSAPLQRFASNTLQRHLRELKGRNVQDGAVLVLDNASGQVLAWVGSSGPLSAAAQVDAVSALRQPGSTLKPFLYAQAIAERRLTAASLVNDSPLDLPTGGGLYIPQNYDHQFKGWVSVRTALAASLNVPAVRTLVMVTPDAFARQLTSLGLPLRESGDYYGYSLALGSAEVSLLTLTNAYRTLANGGRHTPVTTRLAPSKPTAVRAGASAKQVVDPRAAYIVGDILSDPLARVRTFGIDSLLNTRYWSAVKTGTSKDMRDNWAVGWSSRYTVGVWVGNAAGAAMWDVSGTSGAAPVWVAVMNHLHAHASSTPPRAPEGIVQVHAVFDGLPEASRQDWFLSGTGQTRFAIKSGPQSNGAPDRSAALRITAPAPGTIVALDPDIPPGRQRLYFEASGANGRWLMDGKPLARGAQVAWLPWPGRHQVHLLNAQGQVVDEVQIEVRGAGVAQAASK